MTWLSHRVVTATTVLAGTQNVWFAVFATVGSTFPDKVEYWMPGGWQRHHRKTSHWWVMYAVLLGVVYLAMRYFYGRPLLFTSFYFSPLTVIGWFLVGCLLHIAEDAVCGKVPVWHPHKRMYVCPRLFYVGSFGESAFVILCMMLSLAWIVRV